ncbi:hypothetical protein [Paraflavitalea speifideaquila]|uniref:hypothetical protein n=1 Tax=Paraflavitalea speifideaquila TaxID=3076558 RepID=UPI0028E284AE|nr:hypothetical protein [Paraflavitalea speifideiaquila]
MAAHKLYRFVLPNHKTQKMRTTWLILLVMVLAGGAMYYIATRKSRLPLLTPSACTIHLIVLAKKYVYL